MNEKQKFQEYLDKFIQYTIKYSTKENKQIELEKKAFEAGIISENNYIKLKNARLSTMFAYNNLAYYFQKASTKIDENNCLKIYNLLKTMTNVCENSVENQLLDVK